MQTEPENQVSRSTKEKASNETTSLKLLKIVLLSGLNEIDILHRLDLLEEQYLSLTQIYGSEHNLQALFRELICHNIRTIYILSSVKAFHLPNLEK